MRIEQLRTSITDLPPEEFGTLIMNIRAIRRTRPTKKIRAKKAPAKTKRNPRKRMAPQDLFAYAGSLTPDQALALAAKLIPKKK